MTIQEQVEQAAGEPLMGSGNDEHAYYFEAQDGTEYKLRIEDESIWMKDAGCEDWWMM